jgi:hypothetical protein
MKMENINNINVNTARDPIKTSITIMTITFETKNTVNIAKNQEIIKRMTIANKIDFFDKFLSPEINLIFYILNSVLFKISVSDLKD